VSRAESTSFTSSFSRAPTELRVLRLFARAPQHLVKAVDGQLLAA
jgi:hypothetical protein